MRDQVGTYLSWEMTKHLPTAVRLQLKGVLNSFGADVLGRLMSAYIILYFHFLCYGTLYFIVFIACSLSGSVGFCFLLFCDFLASFSGPVALPVTRTLCAPRLDSPDGLLLQMSVQVHLFCFLFLWSLGHWRRKNMSGAVQLMSVPHLMKCNRTVELFVLSICHVVAVSWGFFGTWWYGLCLNLAFPVPTNENVLENRNKQ